MDVNERMRALLGRPTQPPAQPAGSALAPDPDDPAAAVFVEEALRWGAKDPPALYAAVRDRITVNIPGDILTDIPALVQDLRREMRDQFRVQSVDGGAGYGDPPARPAVNISAAMHDWYHGRTR